MTTLATEGRVASVYTRGSAPLRCKQLGRGVHRLVLCVPRFTGKAANRVRSYGAARGYFSPNLLINGISHP